MATLVCGDAGLGDAKATVSGGLGAVMGEAARWSQSADNAIADIVTNAQSLSNNTLAFNFDIPVANYSVGGFGKPAAPTARNTSYVNPAGITSNLITPPTAFQPQVAPTFSETLTVDTSGQPGPAPAA